MYRIYSDNIKIVFFLTYYDILYRFLNIWSRQDAALSTSKNFGLEQNSTITKWSMNEGKTKDNIFLSNSLIFTKWFPHSDKFYHLHKLSAKIPIKLLILVFNPFIYSIAINRPNNFLHLTRYPTIIVRTDSKRAGRTANASRT